jgi:hypothetical protein
MKFLVLIFVFSGCADITKSGNKVKFIEQDGGALEIQEKADRISAQYNCKFVGYVDAKTALFPGSYSVHENEIHTALRNRAARMGANVVISNFYRKPAQGVGLLCPADFLNSELIFTED